MAIYKICNNCNKFVEIKKKTWYDFGNEHIEYVCPECGHIDKTTINHVHYGNDAYK